MQTKGKPTTEQGKEGKLSNPSTHSEVQRERDRKEEKRVGVVKEEKSLTSSSFTLRRRRRKGGRSFLSFSSPQPAAKRTSSVNQLPLPPFPLALCL